MSLVNETGETGRITIPAYEGRGVRLSADQRFRCIDVEGEQCGDLFVFSTDDVREYLSAEHTRVHNSNLFPKVGQSFVTNRRRPILKFVEDNTPGIHDMLVAACDPTRFQELGVTGWHASCQENLQKVMRDFGFEYVEIPQPVNIFTNFPAHEDGTMEFLTAQTKAGDSITLQVEMDAYVVLAACSQDVTAINANKPTPLALEVL